MISCRSDLFKHLKPKGAFIAVSYVLTGRNVLYFGENCDAYSQSGYPHNFNREIAKNYPPVIYVRRSSNGNRMVANESFYTIKDITTSLGFEPTDIIFDKDVPRIDIMVKNK